MSAKVTPTRSAIPASAGVGARRPSTRGRNSATLRTPLTFVLSPTGGEEATTLAPSGGEGRVRGLKDDGRLMNTEHPAERVADLSEGHGRLDRLQDGRQEIVPPPGGGVDPIQGPLRSVLIASPSERLEPGAQGLAHGGIPLEQAARRRLLGDELIHPDDDPRLRLHFLLIAVGGLPGLALPEAA